MARTLTTPATQPVITQQAITEFTISVPHTRNQTDDAMVFDKPHIRVTYLVASYIANGAVDHFDRREVFLSDWPLAFKVDVKDVYDKLVTDAVNAGLIEGPGTDEVLE